MQFFIDSADITEIRTFADAGLIDGVTTNPSLIAASGRKFKETIAEICNCVSGPVSAEVVATDYETMCKEGRELHRIAPNVTVKLPLTLDGLRACRFFADQEIMTNVTLCFSPAQALMAAKAGATFVSPFIGRLDDINHDGLGLLQEIVAIYANYPELSTRVLAASIRSPRQITDAALIGVDVATIPGKILRQLVKHPLTDQGLETFLSDWKKTGDTIL